MKRPMAVAVIIALSISYGLAQTTPARARATATKFRPTPASRSGAISLSSSDFASSSSTPRRATSSQRDSYGAQSSDRPQAGATVTPPAKGQAPPEQEAGLAPGRRIIPGRGAYRTQDDNRIYDDGTVVGTDGNVLSIGGRPLPKGVKHEALKAYLNSNSEATLKEAVEAVKQDQ